MMKNSRILVIGSSNTDITVKTERLPLAGETVIGNEFKMCPGGKGANQAVAAKRLSSGSHVTLICKVGNDSFGDTSVDNYVREGIDTSHIFRSNLPSGVALITVDRKGENCIAVASGSNYDLTVGDIETIKPVIEESGIVLLQLELPIATVMAAARMAHQAGAYVILNPAPASGLPEEMFSCIDLFTPNQSEAEFYSGICINDDNSAKEAMNALRSKGIRDIIITLGSCGSVGFTDSGFFRTPAYSVKAVDTTAAGDTFCGALAVALSEGQSLQQASTFAAAASSITVQRMGAQESIPFRNNVTL